MDALRVLYQEIDARVAAIVCDGWPCRKGCDHCCRSLARQPVLTESEWLVLSPRLNEDSRQRIVDLRDTKLCPLLDTEIGACTIYDVRPVACRTYGFYLDREGGLYCSMVEEQAGKDVVWGNGEAVERRLDAMGPRRTLFEWVIGPA